MKKLIGPILCIMAYGLFGQSHPNLILTSKGVSDMRASIGSIPLFDQTLKAVKAKVDLYISEGINVPLPKDPAGGYTHSRHKANYFAMQQAGVLFQITKEERYAMYIKNMLLKYAEVYHEFDKHPLERSYAQGKFFWQCLNDANWLVYTSQAYDAIYDWLDSKTVKKLNKKLFRPYAEFISIYNPQFFNRIHNHSTWGNAAVGMIGLVIKDKELIKWSLYGLDSKYLKSKLKEDNDGGKIVLNKEAGFLAQIDDSFSPEGYYTEGPYYQRYAMYPFLIFAEALQNQKPELGVLNYRNGLLLKAVYTLIDLTDAEDQFFAINDAQKGMSLQSRELVNAIGMAFYYGGHDPRLLSIIEKQGRVSLSPAGLAAAKAITMGKALPYTKPSRLIFDGKSGDEGAIGILRGDDANDPILVLKYAKHGMGHGHFDRLSFLLFDGRTEVFQDYGAARWVNIKHKYGGGYLKENNTWAKQTVAHNSIVINGVSQFHSNVKEADLNHGEHYLFDTASSQIKIVSAKETNAYPNWILSRTMALISVEELEKPIVLDLLSAELKPDNDSEEAEFSLPLYYRGEFMSSNLPIQTAEVLKPIGDKYGFQHLWMEGQTKLSQEQTFQMTWFEDQKFYSMTSALENGDLVTYTRIGANDPEFNLRRDQGLLINRRAGNTLFASCYEFHGSYDYATERPINSFSRVSKLTVLLENDSYTIVQLEVKSGNAYTFCFSKKNASKEARHSISEKELGLYWEGPFQLIRNTTKNSNGESK